MKNLRALQRIHAFCFLLWEVYGSVASHSFPVETLVIILHLHFSHNRYKHSGLKFRKQCLKIKLQKHKSPSDYARTDSKHSVPAVLPEL